MAIVSSDLLHSKMPGTYALFQTISRSQLSGKHRAVKAFGCRKKLGLFCGSLTTTNVKQYGWSNTVVGASVIVVPGADAATCGPWIGDRWDEPSSRIPSSFLPG